MARWVELESSEKMVLSSITTSSYSYKSNDTNIRQWVTCIRNSTAYDDMLGNNASGVPRFYIVLATQEVSFNCTQFRYPAGSTSPVNTTITRSPTTFGNGFRYYPVLDNGNVNNATVEQWDLNVTQGYFTSAQEMFNSLAFELGIHFEGDVFTIPTGAADPSDCWDAWLDNSPYRQVTSSAASNNKCYVALYRCGPQNEEIETQYWGRPINSQESYSNRYAILYASDYNDSTWFNSVFENHDLTKPVLYSPEGIYDDTDQPLPLLAYIPSAGKYVEAGRAQATVYRARTGGLVLHESIAEALAALGASSSGGAADQSITCVSTPNEGGTLKAYNGGGEYGGVLLPPFNGEGIVEGKFYIFSRIGTGSDKRRWDIFGSVNGDNCVIARVNDGIFDSAYIMTDNSRGVFYRTTRFTVDPTSGEYTIFDDNDTIADTNSDVPGIYFRTLTLTEGPNYEYSINPTIPTYSTAVEALQHYGVPMEITSAQPGDVVRFVATPNSGYEYSSFGVINSVNGESVPTTAVGENEWTITMPTGAVVATITWVTSDSTPSSPGGSNPYGGLPENQPSGGGGTNNFNSDQLPNSSLPGLNISNTGMTRLYLPTIAELRQLSQYLYSDSLADWWDVVKKRFEDPMQVLVGLTMLPIQVPTAGREEVKIMLTSTGVSMAYPSSNWIEIDCGYRKIEEAYGSYLDYSPYTKVSVYLPFIGEQVLNTDEVMGKTVRITYRVEITTGNCIAQISADNNYLYSYPGNMGFQIPMSSNSFDSIVNATLQVAGAVAGALVSGGAALGAAGGTEIAKHSTQMRQPSARHKPFALNEWTSTETHTPADPNTGMRLGGIAAGAVVSSADAVLSGKPSVAHSGSFNGNHGYMGVRYPFFTVEHPRLANPPDFGAFNGYPSMLEKRIRECSGFLQVQQTKLINIPCLAEEYSQIMEMLKEGIIV